MLAKAIADHLCGYLDKGIAIATDERKSMAS